MLALPLQTYAAAIASVHGAARMGDAAAASAQSGAAVSGPAEHCAGHDLRHSTDRSDAPDNAAPATDAGSSSSGTCPVCFAGAAILPSALDWQVPKRQQNLPLAFFDILFSGHIPGGLERPPRSIRI